MPDRRADEGLARADTAAKTHMTAAVLIPDEDCWEPIQRVRRLHDPNVRRWMPHISLLYPFVPHERLPQARIACAEAVARLPMPEVELASFGYFNHPSGRVTLWLDPRPADRIRDIHEALLPLFPHCDDTAKHHEGFVPHLTVGNFLARSDARVVRDELEATWRPMRLCFAHVALIARSGYEKDPFRVVAEAEIGTHAI